MKIQYRKRRFAVCRAALMAAVLVMDVKAGMRFDGKADSIVSDKSVTKGMRAITIMMWVKGEYKTGNLVKGPVLINFHPLGFYLKGGNVYLNWEKGVADNKQWRHLTAVWSNPSVGDGKMKLYIDGIRQKHDLACTNGVLGGGSITLAGKINNNIPGFQGKLEDVRIYDRALTEDDILRGYAGGTDDDLMDGLIVWYPMRDKNAELQVEGDATLLRDSSGNDNHGQIQGTPIWENDDADTAQKRHAQIENTKAYFARKKSACENLRKSLAMWLEKHPEADKKWRGRHEELESQASKRGFTFDLFWAYADLNAEINLRELISTPPSTARGEVGAGYRR